jgi:hypothetical protein
VRQLPDAEQERGWEQLRRQLKAEQPQGEAIDVTVQEVEALEPEPEPLASPF